jgi:glucose dehydrogenase
MSWKFAACTVLTFGASFVLLSGLSGSTARRILDTQAKDQDWPIYLGDNSRTHFSNLDQINKNNFFQLRQAWVYETGETEEFQDNPLIVDGILHTGRAALQELRRVVRQLISSE